MGEVAELMLEGACCEDCGVFLDAEPESIPTKCHDCYVDEMVRAVEENDMPDGMTYDEWYDVKRKYSQESQAMQFPDCPYANYRD